MVGHMGDLGLRPSLLGDILMRTDRAAVGHRLYRYGNAAPVAELAVELAEMSVIASAQHGVDDRLRRHIRQQLVANAMSNDLKQRCPKRHLVGGELIDFRIAAIAEDKPLVGIEHGKPLCDVVQCRVQLDILGPQLLFLHFQQVVLLLEACIESFDLRRRPASFAQIPDCVDLELVQIRTQWLVGYFYRNPYARRSCQLRLPAPHRRRRLPSLGKLQKLADEAPAEQFLRGAITQLSGQFIDVDDSAAFRDEESLVLSCNVEGIPDRLWEAFVDFRRFAPRTDGAWSSKPEAVRHSLSPRYSSEVGLTAAA